MKKPYLKNIFSAVALAAALSSPSAAWAKKACVDFLSIEFSAPAKSGPAVTFTPTKASTALANTTRRLSTSVPPISANLVYKEVDYSAVEIAKLNSILKVSNIEVTTINVAKAAESFVSQANARGLTPRKAADLAGRVGMEILVNFTERLSRERLTMVSTWVEVVSHYESFKPTAFNSDDTLALVSKNLKFVRLDELEKWVKSYISRKGPYYTEIPDDGQGILTFTDIRDTASHNRWVIEYKGHDMKHGHYLFGHPFAANAYFRTARSKNALRYTIMGGLFEGVDTFQFSFEQRITEHFREEKGMTQEEAMLWMAVAPMAKLQALSRELGLPDDYKFTEAIETYRAWRPKKSGEFQPQGFSGKGLDADLQIMMAAGLAKLDDPKMKKYTNYAVDPPRGGAKEDDASIH